MFAGVGFMKKKTGGKKSYENILFLVFTFQNKVQIFLFVIDLAFHIIGPM
jgi:hypothetical protein